MTTFDDIQDIWNLQSDPEICTTQPAEFIQLAEANTQIIKVKHFWTIGILGVSLVLFCWYSLIYVGIQFSWFHFGLVLMFLSLLVRLIIEYSSYISLRHIDIRFDLTHYAKGITQFYINRKKIHYVITPITVAFYITGFLLLLPVLKESLSAGFFWYIVISGYILLILFAVMIVWQIKKEIRLLKFLKKIAL
jgi:hypothetical protein